MSQWREETSSYWRGVREGVVAACFFGGLGAAVGVVVGWCALHLWGGW